jgi:hypothetical protein
MGDEPTPEALQAQEELIRRRNEQYERQQAEAARDPWDVQFDGPAPKGPVDEEAFLTGLADAGHDLADRLQGLKDTPIIGEAADAAGRVLHGIADQRDRDQDGLTDGRELSIGTNPNDRDTDGDKLPDGVELDEYRSNPLRQDTDRDGVSDFDEVSAGINYTRDGTVDVRIVTDDIRTPRVVAPAPKPASNEPGQGPGQGPITRPSQVDPSLALGSNASEPGSITADDLLDGFRRAFQPDGPATPATPDATDGSEPGSITADDLLDGFRRAFQPDSPAPTAPTDGSEGMPDGSGTDIEAVFGRVPPAVPMPEPAMAPEVTVPSIPLPSGDALGGEPQLPAIELPAPTFEPEVTEPSLVDEAAAEPEIELFSAPAAVDGG